MQTLAGKHIQLRALEPEDLQFVLDLENNEDFWEISATQTPYSRYIMEKYVQNADRDIYEVKQLRLVIEDFTKNKLGLIDLFDYNPRHNRAGIGIIIATEKDRDQGYGEEALNLICNFCFRHLQMHQLYASILETNRRSQKVFEQAGFEKTGFRKDWILIEGTYQNELFYQKTK